MNPQTTFNPIVEPLMTTEQAAEFIGMKPAALVQKRFRGEGPPCIRISHRCVRYNKSDLIDWLEKFRQPM